MRDRKAIRRTILELASEDFYGLWEIFWKLREENPHLRDQLGDVLRHELEGLVMEGRIAFYVRTSPEHEPRRVGADDIDWRAVVAPEAPEVGQKQILVAAPDA